MDGPRVTDGVAEPGPLVVLGIVWTGEGPDDGHLRIRRPGGTADLVPAVGLELRYEADPDAARHCIGHRSPRRNDGAYRDCHERPQPGERTCVSCSVADAEFAADLHHAHTRDRASIHEAVLRHLDRPNTLYLAAFRDGSVKVGTSTDGRRGTRLAEQGAWRAVEAASVGDGFAVRRVEDLVTRRLGLPQSVAATRKVRGMAAPRPDADLDGLLAEHLELVHDLLDHPEGREAGPASPADTWWRFPGGDLPVWQGLHRYPVPLDRGRHHLRIEALCGRVAVLARPGGHDRFVADLGPLSGRELTIGDITPDELLVQDTLF